MITKSIIEQQAVYDGEPNFVDDSILIALLNHYSFESVESAFEEDCQNPLRMKTRITVEYEIID